MWHKLLLLTAAGGLGALARHGISNLTYRLCGTDFPWGTIAVNCLGCLLFGFVWALVHERRVLSADIHLIVLVGFMGAFTTFSTFANDAVLQLQHNKTWLALANVAASNVLGIAAVLLGMALARLF